MNYIDVVKQLAVLEESKPKRSDYQLSVGDPTSPFSTAVEHQPHTFVTHGGIDASGASTEPVGLRQKQMREREEAAAAAERGENKNPAVDPADWPQDPNNPDSNVRVEPGNPDHWPARGKR